MMTDGRTNSAVLITGASTGIGRACALHLAGAGFLVYAGVRDEGDADALARVAPDHLTPVILDVTEAATIAAAVELISLETEYPLRGLVNNAGIGISGVLEATPEDEFRRVLEINVIGLHAVTRAVLPVLRANGGRIVNVGSISSYMAAPGSSAYAASKFAVRALTDSLRIEMQPFGVSVSLVAPGAIESEMWDKSRAYKKKLRAETPRDIREAYELFARAGDRMVDTVKPAPADAAVKAVAHALTAGKPKYVYVVGDDARKARFLSRLPTGLYNRLVMSHIRKIAGKPDRS
jgi:NAD(P)-dependent dehydrogenase (short-subunit alcohol dehydrogenase family)